ncbi:MAG: arginine--tRNA ligase [Patescibacteria group bacterium]|nr:arginine--tRNA ligase [Patescibacteria group bacterium]
MKQQLEAAIAAIVERLFDATVPVELTRTDEKFGDYATNVAMQLVKELAKPPREIATEIVAAIATELTDTVTEAQIAGPGFINLTLTEEALLGGATTATPQLNANKRVLLEYSCPNAFKELHTGHLYQTVVGDAIGRLLTASGATIYRANFGGDVGLHVAKCLYAIKQQLGEDVSQLAAVPPAERPSWISTAYVAGASAYETDEAAKQAITEINTQIYSFHDSSDHDSQLAKIYWECRGWSYEYFKAFYESIVVSPFNSYYPESGTAERGLSVVRVNTPPVFEASNGAVVFKGEDAGLHTRVFITSKGLPTYETKDLGVIYNELDDFKYDHRYILTGNDQLQYMQVVFAALAAIDPELAAKQTHLTNGTIRFGSGQKMSSRLGNVTRAADVLAAVGQAVTAIDAATKQQVTLGAIKYTFLKHRLGGDIAFDVNESVSLEGNSGPYLQYALARACSILDKAGYEASRLTAVLANDVVLRPGLELETAERLLVRKLTEYQEVLAKAITELLPHQICNYLYELAQDFNRFYENNRVIGNERQELRLLLIENYARTLHHGLSLLGLPTPQKM